MAEEPKQKESAAQGNKEKDTRLRGGREDLWSYGWRNLKENFDENPILKFFGKNPTFVLSLLYLYVTGMGLLYSRTLYGTFGINVVDYSTVADFLLAAFQNPSSFVFAVGMAILLCTIFVTLVSFEGLSRDATWLGIVAGLLAVVISAYSMHAHGRTVALSIKHGADPAVDVRYRSFAGTAGQVTEPGLQLIGSTQRAVFFYDVNARHTIVIPQAQIVSIEVPE